MSKVNPFIRTTTINGAGMAKYMEQDHCDCNFECDCYVDWHKTDKNGWRVKAEAIFIEDAIIQKVEHIVDYRKNWSNGREMTRYENHERAALGLANRYEFEFDSMDGRTNSMNDGYHFKLK